MLVIGALTIVIACALISGFCLQLAIVDGESMAPTYKSKQFVFVDKTCNDFQRGDVIAFRSEKVGFLIKRIAAVGGDSVKISDGKIIVNGVESPEYKNIFVDYSGIAEETVQLRENEFFVLGDNICESKDSRYEIIGTVKANEIIGKVIPQKIIKAS